MEDIELLEEAEVDGYNPQKWENPPKLSDLKNDLTQAQTPHNTAVERISKWLDVLNATGTAAPTKVKGKSSMQPKLAKKLAEWRYPALSEPFLSTYDLFDVSPVTAEDKKSAYENQMLLNYQFNCQINKQKFIDQYVRTAVDQGTVILRTGWRTEVETVEEDIEEIVLTPDQSPDTIRRLQYIQGLIQSNSEEVKSVPEHWMEAFKVTYQKGIPHSGSVRVTGTRKVEKETVNQPDIKVCHYKNTIIDPAANGVVEKAQFIIHSFETSKSELAKEGIYDNLDDLKVTTQPIADSNHTTRGGEDNSFQFNDEPRKRMIAYEYWGYWDIDGTGETKSVVITWVDNVVIRMEENPYPNGELPFEIVHYLPEDNSNHGKPDADLTEDNQRIIGAVTRGMIDTMARSAAGQVGVQKGALDVVNYRKFQQGKDFEYNGGQDPRSVFHMNQYPELPSSTQVMLQMQNTEAEALTGVRPFAGTNGGQDIANMSATQARGMLDAASKREVSILRRLADGIVRAARKVVAMNAVFLSDEEIVRLTNNEFITVSRDTLAGKYDLKLSVSTAEEDNAKAQELAFMLQTGAASADPAETRMIRAEIARLRNMPALAKKIEDFQPQPDPIEQQIRLLELQIKQAELQKIGSETQENMAEANLKNAKAANTQSDTDNKDLNFVNDQTGVTHNRELDKQGAQAQANMKYKAFEHSLNKDLEYDKARLNNMFNNKTTNP